MAIKSFGITVTLGGTTIADLTDVNISGRDVSSIETTVHTSPPGVKTFIGGLIDNGTLELTGNLTGGNATIVYLEVNLGQTVAAVVTYSDGKTHLFDCIVGAPSITNPIDDKIGFTCSCKITGAITGTATTA